LRSAGRCGDDDDGNDRRQHGEQAPKDNSLGRSRTLLEDDASVTEESDV
jgi:hypothetical protein